MVGGGVLPAGSHVEASLPRTGDSARQVSVSYRRNPIHRTKVMDPQNSILKAKRLARRRLQLAKAQASSRVGLSEPIRKIVESKQSLLLQETLAKHQFPVEQHEIHPDSLGAHVTRKPAGDAVRPCQRLRRGCDARDKPPIKTLPVEIAWVTGVVTIARDAWDVHPTGCVVAEGALIVRLPDLDQCMSSIPECGRNAVGGVHAAVPILASIAARGVRLARIAAI